MFITVDIASFFHFVFYLSYGCDLVVIKCFTYLHCVQYFYSVDWVPTTNRISHRIKKKVFVIRIWIQDMK